MGESSLPQCSVLLELHCVVFHCYSTCQNKFTSWEVVMSYFFPATICVPNIQYLFTLQDAKKDESVRKSYKYLAALHEVLVWSLS